MIRNYLEIKKLSEEFDSPEITVSALTTSPEAFKYYIHSFESFTKLDIQTTVEWLLKSIEMDSEFINAYVFLSFVYTAGLEYQLSETWCNKAYAKRDKLPVREKLFLDHLHAYHYETPREEIKYCMQLLEIDEMNTIYWLMLGDAYYKLEQYEEAVIYFEKTLEIYKNWGTSIRIPHLFFWMSDALHQLGNHKRENEIYELALEIIPNNGLIVRYQAECALSRVETELAKEYLSKYRSIREAQNWDESRILSGIGTSYYYADMIDEAEDYFRQALALDSENPRRLNSLAWLLIKYDIDLVEGMELAEKAMKIPPEHYSILDTWGWGLYKQERYEEALVALNRSWELRGPYDAVILRHIRTAEKALEQESSN